MTEPTIEIRRKHLAEQLKKSKLSRSDFANKLGISRSYLTQLLTEGFRFGEKSARALEKKLRLPDGFMDSSAESEVRSVEVWESPDDLPEGVFAIVPRVAIQLSAGSGAISEGEMDLPPLAFRADWLKKKNVTSRDNLRVCEVSGDSMEGYLYDGDSVLIDIGQRDLVDNEVYAIRYGDELRIKRIGKRFDGGIIIKSDNPRYQPESLSPSEAEQIHIIGRKIWRGG
ncbi:LexA family transcriptional regulator [Rhodoferax mekongensis]|uniref:LexA family transcriptional regulator n=1 Tax=Rhodoferax mekongensis TaxID=3068341 RepID=A0ABZ0B2D7_9BURK|nr:LexA family transcriptional regulator [Rhodoferax sp. TBRC 17307]WNO05981.1 LexA family transcriptional regulator [Rhodoferax sp. TBRC 17307]